MGTVVLKHCYCHIEIRCLPAKPERYLIRYRTVFDLYGNERLFKWKQFRDSIEVSDHPLDDVAEFWSHAPFVNPFLDPEQPKTWPDPWHLVIDGKLDDLAICLGMLYTVKLTQRFMHVVCEIHKSMLPQDHDARFFLVVDNAVLNYEPRIAHDLKVLRQIKTHMVWRNAVLPINIK